MNSVAKPFYKIRKILISLTLGFSLVGMNTPEENGGWKDFVEESPEYLPKTYFSFKESERVFEELTRPDCVASDQVEIDARATPERIEQGRARACFGVTAYMQLQYLYNVHEIYHLGNPNPKNMSVAYFIGKASGKKFPWGGFDHEVLEVLKGASIYAQSPLPAPRKHWGSYFYSYELQEAYKLTDWIGSVPPDEAPYDHWARTFQNIIDQRTQQKGSDLVKQAVERNRETAAYDLIFPEETSHLRESIPLPSYSYQNYKPTDADLENALKENPNSSKEGLVKEKVRALFVPVGPELLSYPVTLNFCIGKNAKGCRLFHSTLISGVRKLCCGENCFEEWKLLDSGNISEKWHNADLLSESVVQFNGSLTSVRSLPPGEVEAK